MEKQTTLIKIDPWSVLKVILVFLGFWFLYLIRDVILIFLIAAFLSIIIIPAVNFFERKKFPRWLGVLVVYLIILAAVVFLSFLVFPTLISQGKVLLEKIPDYFKSILGGGSVLESDSFFEAIKRWLTTSSPERSQIFSFFGNVVSGLFTTIMVFIIAFYLSVDREFINRQIIKFSPLKYRNFLTNFYSTAQQKIGAWSRGALSLCFIIGVLSYLGLLILGVKFALVLAVLAGVTEIIPYVGPWIGGTVAFIVALVDSPMKAFLVAIFYLILQQAENSLIVPLTMRKAVGLNPVVVLVVLLIGGKLAGPIGTLLAVPVATIIGILVKEYLNYKKEINQKSEA